MRKYNLIPLFISVFSFFFATISHAGESEESRMKQGQGPAEVYIGMRDMALQIKASDLGLNEQDAAAPYGVLMETGYAEAVATLVVLADGTVSVYFSNGGGMIGGGGYRTVQEAGAKLIQESAKHLSNMEKVSNYPLPGVGHTRFYIITGAGIYSVEKEQERLGEGDDSLSALFYAAQEVITQFRLESEKNSQR